jgi:hypothetical protein
LLKNFAIPAKCLGVGRERPQVSQGRFGDEAARILSDPRQKAKLLAMAQSWISLADLAEHFDRIDETPPRRESHIH